MTSEQALKILDDVTAGISLDRRNHQIVMQALQVLSQALSTQKPKETK